jgi:hypothetical protein
LFGKRKITVWTKNYANTVVLNRTEWNTFMSAANEMVNRFFERYTEKIAASAK